MALSNKERVGRVLDLLASGLAPYVLREYRMVYKDDFAREIDAALTTSAFELPREALDDIPTLLAHLDTQNTLNLMWRRWNEVFQDKLGYPGRSYVSELMGARNDWAHQKAFSNDEAYRVADTAARLLKMISAGEAAAAVEKISGDLLRLRYEEEARKSKKKAETGPLVEGTTPAGLKAWRLVVQPHPDVASGRYLQAEFAADMAQVLAGTAEREYQDPKEFFRRTYLTGGLLDMLVTGIKRLTAQGGDPVVQLQTAFGGGKTHSMLALYHLSGGGVKLSDFVGGERIARLIGNVDLPEANRAVLVGTAISPTNPKDHPDATTRTLWGEMAYQLGGAAGYEMVALADQKGVSPNSDALKQLLDRFGPCLIIIDELVAYARNIYNVDGLPAGSFNSVMTFVQALTEAVRRTTDSMLLISLPESKIEMGGEAGANVLEQLAHVVGRIESVWKPVTATESFEIVRRRLFAPEVDHAARDAVLAAFGDMYRASPSEFPAGKAEKTYHDRLAAAYPIHPELFDQLYENWSTLERFQRTRGVLRLMAAVIHELWVNNDPSLLILPGTIPLAETPVRNELLRYLPDGWTPVLERDVDGDDSLPLQIDGNVPALGRLMAARRVARTVFMGSAPSVAAQRVRGLEEARIRLGCAQPGESAPIFGDALRRMSSQLTYLYSDGSRYWYDTRPTVNRLAQDRAQALAPAEVRQEIVNRLQKAPRNRDFAAFHVAPPGSGDVADEDRARIVVLPPDATHRRQRDDSEAMGQAAKILSERGNAQRLYKNMLIFIAPDENGMAGLETAVRDYLAWRSISDDEETLNLDAQQRRQVGNSLKTADNTISSRLQEAYQWLIVPEQPEPLGPIALKAHRISGSDSLYDRAAQWLRTNDALIRDFSPDSLKMDLDNYIWNDERGYEVGLRQLWGYFAQYCYLPRLLEQDVLLQAVRDGVNRIDAPFAYATGTDGDGHHTGVVFRQLGAVYFDEASLLVHPDHLRRPVPVAPPAPEPDRSSPLENGKGADASVVDAPAPAQARRPVRYYGRARLDSQRVTKEMDVVVEEIIQRLTELAGCEVEIVVEIAARKPDGFDEGIVRTISENGRTLKFDTFGFEEE